MDEILKRYEALLKLEKVSNYSMKGYLKFVEKFLHNLNIQTWGDLDRLTIAEVQSFFVQEQEGNNWKQRTFNTYLSYIKAFNRRLIEQEIITNKFCDKIRNQTPERKAPVYFTKEEMRAMIFYNTKERDNLMLKILFKTGVRVGELRSIRMSKIKGNMLTVSRKKTERTIPIDDILLAEIKEYYNNKKVYMEDYLFHTNQGKPISDDWISRRFKDQKRKNGTVCVGWMTKARIPQDRQEELHTHCTRKTFATLYYEENHDIAGLQELLGHQDIKTTKEHYVFMTNQAKQSSVANIQFGF